MENVKWQMENVTVETVVVHKRRPFAFFHLPFSITCSSTPPVV
jgi:hypothetical protein